MIRAFTPYLIALTLLFASTADVWALAQNQQIDEMRREYDSSFAKRSNLTGKLSGLEREYQELARQVDKRKKSGGMTSIRGRLELEELLRKSKKLSERLNSIQKQIRTIDSSLETKRQVMVKGLEQEMTALERTLSSAKPSKRGTIVGELNKLRKVKLKYAQPLPEVPNAATLDSVIRDSENVGDDPEALSATADELQDSEDQLRARVSAIESQLKELKATRSLIRRAKSFSKEERFFEESDRARVIAKYDVSNGSKSTTSNGASNQSPNPPNERGSTEETFESGNNFDSEAVNTPLATEDNDSFAGADPVAERNELTDSPTPSVSVDPFAGSKSIRIDAGGDPSRSIGSSETSSTRDLGRKIESLQAEQKRLKRQADKLKSRAKKLRKRAEKL